MSDILIDNDDIAPSIRKSMDRIRDAYRNGPEGHWIVGFSGGKDSTLLLHLVASMLLHEHGGDRQVIAVTNDTLVESPPVISYARRVVSEVERWASAKGLPLRAEVTLPAMEETFWVNLIGKGYPAPTRNFRWCTDRLKIKPTSRFINKVIETSPGGQVVLLLGVRKDESSSRKRSIGRYGEEKFRKHPSIPSCLIFQPITDVTTDEVWEFLALNPPPWGGDHRDLIELYRDAGGGECPVVTSLDDAPSCGTNSSRFGCWTCTVVAKDRSLEGFVKAGNNVYTPLVEFREFIVKLRNDPDTRMDRKRNNTIVYTSSGRIVKGPFKLEIRKLLLEKLLQLEREYGAKLISDEEISEIKRIWEEDARLYQTEPRIIYSKRKDKGLGRQG